ncbi:MAG: LysR family transcriptional regulator [Aliiglaciecola sp.]
MQSQYDDLDIFCTVANFNSYYRAAKHLGMPHSTVSRRVANLEEKLSAQLIIRTTRQMRLTEKGKALFEQTQPLLSQLKVAVSDSLDEDGELKGPLRITMPTRVGLDYMGEILLEFNKLHPGLELFIELNNENTDLVKENIDLAFRVGPLVDSSAIAVRLWDIPFRLLAHQDLVQRYNLTCGNFELKQLANLPCAISYPQNRWLFEHDKQGEISVTPKPSLQVNDLTIALEAAKKGLGIVYVPEIILKNASDCSELVDLRCDNWQPTKRTMFAFYTANRTSSRKIKAVVEYVKHAYKLKFGE